MSEIADVSIPNPLTAPEASFAARVASAASLARRWTYGAPESPMRREVGLISSVMLELVKKHGQLERENARLLRGRAAKPSFRRVPVKATTPREQAQQIADLSGDAPLVVYRRKGGALGWAGVNEAIPTEAEIVGCYDHGSDVRDIEADLTA